MPKETKNLHELIGNTPLAQLKRMVPANHARILAKLESHNPSGSIKDRSALAMIEDAERAGRLKAGYTIVEASAGNMGISVAMVAAVKGYRVVIVMPESMSLERIRHLERFGAQMYLTNSSEGMDGAHKAARELVQGKNDHIVLDQFHNPANPRAHRETTGKEIVEATSGEVDAFVAGVGTGGTITGVGEALKEANSKVQIVAVEPAGSPMLSEGRTGEHGIAGIGADFVPPLLNRRLIDRVIAVSDRDAQLTAERLGKEEGLLVGISSGANVYAALEVAKELGSGKTVVTILPDGGERYLKLP